MANDITRRENGNQRQGQRGTPMPNVNHLVEQGEEYARAAQRYIDQINQIAELTREVEEWRGRAVTAEAEVERLLERERSLIGQLDQHHANRTAEFHDMQQTLMTLQAEFGVVSRIVLDAYAKIDAVGAARTKAAMPAVVAAIEQAQEDLMTHGGPQPNERQPD